MDTKSLLRTLMQLRIGHVLTPEQSSEAQSHLPGAPQLSGYSLNTSAPHWLVAQLEDTAVLRRQQFGLLTTQDYENPIFMVVLQSGSSQLRLLMHLNHSGVQALLRDALSRGQLNVMLDIEHGTQVSILSSLMPNDADTMLSRMLDAVRERPGHLPQVLKLAALHTLPEAVPSLLDGESVTDVVTVLVADAAGSLTEDEVRSLTGSHGVEQDMDEEAQVLH